MIQFRCLACKKKLKGFKRDYKQLKQDNTNIKDYVACPHCNAIQRKLKLFVYNRDKYTCQRCGTHRDKLGESNFLTQHHVIARCNGDTHKVDTINNVVTWCWTCHKEYNKKHPVQRLEVLVTS